MASIGGNLMQRPRCLYFRDVSADCNRRAPGYGLRRDRRPQPHPRHLGTSDPCIATHPSDLAVALIALDAAVITRDGSGEHRIPVSQFFRRPGSTPDQEHDLGARRTDRGRRSAGRAGGPAVGLCEGARPRVVRVRPCVGGGGAGHRRGHGCARLGWLSVASGPCRGGCPRSSGP